MKINDITSDNKKQDLEKFERAKRFVKGFEGDVGVLLFLRKEYNDNIKNLPKSERKSWLKRNNVTLDQLNDSEIQPKSFVRHNQSHRNSGCLINMILFGFLFLFIFG